MVSLLLNENVLPSWKKTRLKVRNLMVIPLESHMQHELLLRLPRGNQQLRPPKTIYALRMISTLAVTTTLQFQSP